MKRILQSRDCSVRSTIGSPSSKYEHRRTSALLRNIRKYKDLYGKKTYRFCNLPSVTSPAPVDINTRERKQREQETVSHPECE